MSYYLDLFLRPKQAVAWAYANPSIIRSIGFVILGTLLGVVASQLLFGEFTLGQLIGGISGDAARWLAGGILLCIIGLFFKRISFSGENITRSLTLLAQLSLYGFFIFLLMGILFPFLVVPDFLVASNQLNNGVIGPEEFSDIINASLSQPNVPLVGGILFLLTFILLLYSLYVLLLSTQKYLDTTTLKAAGVSLVILALQGFLTLLFL